MLIVSLSDGRDAWETLSPSRCTGSASFEATMIKRTALAGSQREANFAQRLTTEGFIPQRAAFR